MGYLLLRNTSTTSFRLCFVFSILINIDCNKHEQTSRLVAGAQIQTSGNFEKKNMFGCGWVLDFVHRRSIYVVLESTYITRWYQYIALALRLVTTIFAYTKIFFTPSHNHQFMFRTMLLKDNLAKQFHGTQLDTEKAVYSSLWVQVPLVVCYLPYSIVFILALERGNSLSVYFAFHLTQTLVCLNPLMYCWRIREVTQAVKGTLRQLSC